MSTKIEYLEESDGENESIVVEQVEPGEYYEEIVEPEQIKPVVVTVATKKPGTVVLAPGTITLPPIKKNIIPISDKQKVRELLDKYKALGGIKTTSTPQRIASKSAQIPIQNNNIETAEIIEEHVLEEEPVNHEVDVARRSNLTSTSLRDRFLHRRNVMRREAEKSKRSLSQEKQVIAPKRIKRDPTTYSFDIFENIEANGIHWDTDKDLLKANPTMFDTELLQVVVKNQQTLDTKLNLIYQSIQVMQSKNDEAAYISGNTRAHSSIRSNDIQTPDYTFSQIPIRNNAEFLSLDNELKSSPESVEKFEALLDNLGSPENYSEFVKRITNRLFTPNFMEVLGWSQIGVGGLQLKETAIKESIFNVFTKKYDGIHEDILNEKFSQHFRSFRMNRNKNRTKLKELSESSS